MGSRSTRFDDLEAGGLPHAAEDDGVREPAYAGADDEDEDMPKAAKEPTEEDELAIAEREYQREIGSGMNLSEEEFAV